MVNVKVFTDPKWGETMSEIVLAADRVSKAFGGVQVLFSVDFQLRRGEVHALMGENGAGKSTLVKILSGFEQPSSGQVMLDGQPVRLPPDGRAEALGIAIIHQEFNLAEDLTVTESMFLGREITRLGILDRRAMRRATRAALDQLGADIPEDATIRSLPVAARQMVEIAKAISRRARVVIMDEPTAVLTRAETDILFAQIRRLKSEGTSFVFVSHKLDEVMALSDRITILRDGQWIKTAEARDMTGERIAQAMVGRELSTLFPPKREPDVDEALALEVRGLSTGYVQNASFKLRCGEVMGFAGLIGSGRTELMEAIVGLRPREGVVLVDGVALAADLGRAMQAGLAYLTKDRKGRGLLLGQGMGVNLTLQSLAAHAPWGWLNRGSEATALERARRRFDIRVRDPKVVAGRMSGGNQQKLLLAKVMERAPKVILIDEPTRGIDVGTKQQIYNFIAGLAAEGAAIIVVSSEMPEVIGLCTKVAVMREGRIVGQLEGDAINETEIMRFAAGLKAA